MPTTASAFCSARPRSDAHETSDPTDHGWCGNRNHFAQLEAGEIPTTTEPVEAASEYSFPANPGGFNPFGQFRVGTIVGNIHHKQSGHLYLLNPDKCRMSSYSSLNFG